MATSLRVLTFNVKLFSSLMKLPNGGTMPYERNGLDDAERTRRIADVVTTASPAYDVVCFQELFNEDRRDDLAKRFKKAGYWVIRKASDGDLFHEDSGLFIAARHKMDKRYYFQEFEQSAGDDSFADKGVLGCWLWLDAAKYGARSLVVLNTHLQADPENPSDDELEQRADVRRAQLRQARRFLARYLRKANHGETSAILCGDLNVIEASTAEYQTMLTTLRSARDLFREKATTDPGYTWDGTNNRNMVPDEHRTERQRLDYVFAFDRVPQNMGADPGPLLRKLKVSRARVQRFTTTPTTRLSDHYALDVTVRV